MSFDTNQLLFLLKSSEFCSGMLLSFWGELFITAPEKTCHMQDSYSTRAVARKKLQPRRRHGPLYEISRMKSSNIISLIKKIKIDSI